MLEGRLIVVVVPAFCEEARIANVVRTVPPFVDHVIVVDDASTDETSARARAASSPAHVRVVRHPVRRGVGGAIVTGYRAALDLGGRPEDAFCVMAGDGQMDPADLSTVASPIVRNVADYVKGNRFGAGDIRQTMGFPRWLGGQVFSFLTSLAIGQPITDSQCGFTALSRRAALRLDLDGLWPSFGYPNDLLGQLAARRLRIKEVPVRAIYGDEQSKLRLRHLPPIGLLIARSAWRRRKAPAEGLRMDDVEEEELRERPRVSS